MKDDILTFAHASRRYPQLTTYRAWLHYTANMSQKEKLGLIAEGLRR